MKHESDGIVSDLSCIREDSGDPATETLGDRAIRLEGECLAVELERILESGEGQNRQFITLRGRAGVEDLWRQLREGAASTLVQREEVEALRAGDLVGVATVVLPGTVYSVAFEEALLAMLTGVPTVLLPSRRMEDSVLGLVSSLRAAFPGIASNLYAAVPHDRAAILTDSSSEFVRIYGSDETVDLIGAMVSGSVRIQSYGSMRSAALISIEELGEIEEIVQALIVDLCTWGGEGCFSPHDVFLTASDEDADAFCQRLSDALNEEARKEPKLARIGYDVERDLAVGTMRGGVAYRGAVPILRSGVGHLGESVSDTQVLNVREADSINEVCTHFAESNVVLSTLGLSRGAQVELKSTGRRLQGFAHRVVELGAMQRPRFERSHDGQPRLRPLVQE